MEENSHSSEEIKKKVEEIHKKIQPALYEHNPASQALFEEYERTIQEYNNKIVQVTEKIREERPELVKYLDEMTVTIPDHNHPEVSIKILKEYYDSLIALLDRYILEHPNHAA